jgi:hypothetical protein
MPINLVSPGRVTTAFLITDTGTAAGGSSDAIAGLTKVNNQPVTVALELQSSLGGLLLSRLTTAERNLMVVTNGFMIYNSDENTFNIYQNNVWTSISNTLNTISSVVSGSTAAALSVNTVSGVATITLGVELVELALLSGIGFVTRVDDHTYTNREFTVGSSNLTIANGDGVAGLPAYDLNTTLTNLTSIDVGNLLLSANTIDSTSGSITLNPNGGASMVFTTGYLVLNADPTTSLGAVTKQYVDAIAAGLSFKTAAYAGTTANLSATQAGAGVGATLTNNATQAAFSVDGVSPPINSRILVKDQSATSHNGIYSLTTVGTGATNWVLTRTTDYDQAVEIVPGNIVAVNNGTINAGTSWVQTATVTTVDTDPILFSQFTFNTSNAKYILQTATSLLPNAQSLGALTTGLLKNTVTASTGVLSKAVAGTDYYSPGNPTTIIDTATSVGVTDNLFVGTLSGNLTLSGSNNSGFGVNVLTALTNGGNNTAGGFQSGVSLTSASNNTLWGYQSGAALTSSPANAFFGYQSGHALQTGVGGNAGFGYASLQIATTLVDSTAFGADAGSAQLSYTSCSFLGFNADASVNALTNATAIGANASVSASNCLVLGSSANVGIGVSNPSELLHVVGNIRISTANALKLYNAGNTHFAGIKGGNTASDITWTWPITDAVGALQSDGSGTLSIAPITTLGSLTGIVKIDASSSSNALGIYTATYSTGTASQSGTTVTGSGTAFNTNMTGGLLVWANGTSTIIYAVTSSTVLQVLSTATVTSQAFVIYYGGFAASGAFASVGFLVFSGNFTPSYVGAPLDYYEELTITANWTGVNTVSRSVYLSRIGNIVTMRVDQVTSGSGNSVAVWTFGTVIPSRFLPSTSAGDLNFPIRISTNSTTALGLIIINTTTATVGTVTAYATITAGSFASTGTSQIFQSSFSWTMQ